MRRPQEAHVRSEGMTSHSNSPPPSVERSAEDTESGETTGITERPVSRDIPSSPAPRSVLRFSVELSRTWGISPEQLASEERQYLRREREMLHEQQLANTRYKVAEAQAHAAAWQARSLAEWRHLVGWIPVCLVALAVGTWIVWKADAETFKWCFEQLRFMIGR